jgi:WD40 repeat protein
LKCLEKNPRLRYETAAALAADLRNFLSGNPTAARSLTSAQRLVKWTRRRPALAALLAVSVAATLGFVVLTSMYIARLATAREAAEVSRAGAEESAKTAESQEQLASRFMYASEMRNAYEAIGNGAAAQAEQLLQKYQPGSRFASLRGFEWYHLRSRVHGEQSTLRGHRGQVYAVAFQPDGRVLASGAEDGSIKFWNPLDAAELASLSAHTNCVNALAYSPDGQILVSGSCDHKIKVWQATTHELLATLEGHPDNVRCLAISPDGRLLASGGNDPAVRVWDLATRKLLKSCDTESTTVDSVAWRNDSRSLVMVASKVIDRGKCRILLWNIERDNPISLVDAASNIPILPIGSDIYLGSTNGHIQVIDERGLVQMELPIGHTSGATALASSSSGNWLASGYADAAVCIWGRDKQRFKQSLTGHTGRVQSLAFSPTRDLLLASASFDGTVKLWDIQRDSMPRVVVDCVKGSIADSQHPTAISPDLRYVAYRRSADRVEVVDIDGNRLPITDATTGAACAPFPESVTLGLDFLPGDQPVLFGIPNPNGMLSSWNVTQGTFLEAIPKSPLRPAQNIIFSSNGRHLICTTPASVAISDMQTGETWCRLEMPANHSEPSVVRWPYVVFSPDRETLAVSGIGDLQTVTWLIDLHAKRCRSPIPRATIAVCDQAKLIAVNQTHSIVLVDPTSGSERFVLWHDADLSCVAFSPDARTLAAATVDGRVYLWHVPTGGALTQLEMGSVAFVKLQFSRDNRKLAALAKDYGPGDTATMKFFVWEGVDGP